MKIILTGASGTLAHSLIVNNNLNEILKIDCQSERPEIIKNDLSIYTSIERIIQRFSPDYIFHFAALTDVDYCELNRLEAINKNYVSTKNIVDACLEYSIPLVYISSACVFDGISGYPYKELDRTNPANFHGWTKLWSEQYILKKLTNYIIFRIGWLFGNPEIDKKFIGNLYRQIKNGVNQIYGVSDLRGTVTFADDLIEMILLTISKNLNGIFHYGSINSASRFEIISYLLNKKLNLGNKIEVIPVSFKHFNPIAIRPKNEILENVRLNSLNLGKVFTWETKLDKYINDYFNE
jgi:dTDP-4-dehydrorhamnose reductase